MKSCPLFCPVLATSRFLIAEAVMFSRTGVVLQPASLSETVSSASLLIEEKYRYESALLTRLSTERLNVSVSEDSISFLPLSCYLMFGVHLSSSSSCEYCSCFFSTCLSSFIRSFRIDIMKSRLCSLC